MSGLPEQRVLLLLLDGLGLPDSGAPASGFETYLPDLHRLFRRYPSVPLRPAAGSGRDNAGGLFRYFVLGTGHRGESAQARIREAVGRDTLGTNAVLQEQFARVRQHQSAWHLVGLLSDSGRHSEFGHSVALLRAARAAGLPRVFVHCFLDGRDMPEQDGVRLVEDLVERLRSERLGTLATVIGRRYAMAVGNRWGGIEKTYRLMVCGEGSCVRDPIRGIRERYAGGYSDWNMPPLLVCREDDSPGIIRNQDEIFFCHTRTDGIYRLMSTFSLRHFAGFERKRLRVGMAALAGWPLPADIPVAFEQPVAVHGLGAQLAKAGKRQIHIAGMAHYHRVGTVLQGGNAEPPVGDDRVFIPDEDSAEETGDGMAWLWQIADAVREAIRDNHYALVTAYLAVEDLPGFHTNRDRFHDSLRHLDEAVSRLVQSMLKQQGSVVLTAGAGHAQFFNSSGVRKTGDGQQSSTVPCLICVPERDIQLKAQGTFSDVAPTVLDLLDLSAPEEMTGQSLLLSRTRF